MKKIKEIIKSIYLKIKRILINYKKVNMLNEQKMIEMIIKNKVSISRFGDGEFNRLLNINNNSYQELDENLSLRLKEILISDDKRILLCLPQAFYNMRILTNESKMFWQRYIDKNWKLIKPYININRKYGNAHISRPYMPYKDKNKEIISKKFSDLKKIWENKNLIIVEGSQTLLGINNDLFENSKSIKRIIVPSTHAFRKYDSILSECIKNDKNVMFLLAIGPTATVLAYDLAMKNYQAIDIGHIDIEYEWFIRGEKKRIPIPGKYVYETKEKYFHKNISDKNYVKSIISKIE